METYSLAEAQRRHLRWGEIYNSSSSFCTFSVTTLTFPSKRKETRVQLRQLEYVAAIVRWKSMRKAAQELYISEATMSQQLRALEAELGFRLFQRENRVLRLSPEGEKLLPDLEAFLQAKGEFEQRIDAVRGAVPQVLRLALNPYAAMLFLTTIYRKFRSLYPHIALEITEGGTYKLAEQIRTGQLDLALFALSDLLPAEWDDLAFQLLCKTEGAIIASRHHTLAHKENISKEHLVYEVKIDYSEDYISRNLYKTVLGNLGAITSIHHPESLLELVQEGTGIMIVPRYMMKTGHMETRHCSLRILDLAPEIHFPLSYVCAYSRQRHLPEYSKRSWRLFKNVTRRFLRIAEMRLKAKHHSPSAACSPHKENWRKPRTSLMTPMTGSTVYLRAL